MSENLNKKQAETFDHLENGRFRLALSLAKELITERPQDSEAAISYAWALMENGDAANALEYANMAVELKNYSVKAKLYRGYILMRLSIFEGALNDFDNIISSQTKTLAWTYHNKAKTLAGMGKYSEAINSLDKAIEFHENEDLKKCRVWYKKAQEIAKGKIKLSTKIYKQLLIEAQKAYELKEYWFSLLLSRALINGSKIEIRKLDAYMLELESMFKLFQFRPALTRADEVKDQVFDHKNFEKFYSTIKKMLGEEKSESEPEEKTSPEPEKKAVVTKPDTSAKYFPNDFLEAFSIKMFSVEEDKQNGKRNYYSSFDTSVLKSIGTEIVFINQYFRMKTRSFSGFAVWYINNELIGKVPFKLKVDKDWDSLVYAETLSIKENQNWDKGQAKVEIFIEDDKVCEKNFMLSDEIIYEEKEKLPSSSAKPPVTDDDKKDVRFEISEADEKSLEESIAELEEFTGLESIKKGIKDFISYLEFINERKKAGLKAKDEIAINALFLGNPGTGKTTIARIMGNILKQMGILQRGHVVEVDRAAMVGQYVGETAQKTDKLIEEAMGGVLFIDEAYTLVKQGGGQDFGQEAIDILLKRMEDRKGQFTVIAAGYPEEMNTFLNSNPGMKSRFTHSFTFEDYTPDELFTIISKNAEAEEFNFNDEAGELLKKQFIQLYRDRDQSFGNARLARQIFEDLKINLSKRYLELEEEKRSREAMTTFTKDDVEEAFGTVAGKTVLLPINEEALTEANEELNSLTGLTSVKVEVNNIIKLARYYIERGEDASNKFNSHILFLGSPGTGKTTVARIISKIFAALGILPKGHLVETDRQGLVAGFVGQTAEKTSALIDKAIGGTLFIDEAYALVKGDDSRDFGKEAIDTLLKRMEDDRGKFIVIAAGYTGEMNKFIQSNPGMQSRFNRTLTFEDYNPEELLNILNFSLTSKSLQLSKAVEEKIKIYFEFIYKKRDKNFGNARIVRNIISDAQHKMLLRLTELSPEERTDETEKTIISEDIKEFSSSEFINFLNTVESDSLENYLRELNKMSGIKKAKEKILATVKSLELSQLRKSRGLKVLDKNLNTLFLGNAGCGKKSIASVLGKIYKSLNVISKGHIVKVSRTDLVAGYPGQTAVKTEEYINKASGGILYIENAQDILFSQDDYGYEAFRKIAEHLEKENNDFIVILSGQPQQMKQIVEANQDVRQYFNSYYYFEDLQPRELLEITNQIAEENGYNLDEGALQSALEIFNDMYENKSADFTNAKLAKKLLYTAIGNQEERIAGFAEYSDEELMTINFDDVSKISTEILI